MSASKASNPKHVLRERGVNDLKLFTIKNEGPRVRALEGSERMLFHEISRNVPAPRPCWATRLMKLSRQYLNTIHVSHEP